MSSQVELALSREMKAAEVLKAGLRNVTDDTDTLRDTIEGATSLHECIRAVLVGIEDDQAMVDGLNARIEDLAGRRHRFKERIEFKRTLIEQALVIGEVATIETDIATAYLRAVPASVKVMEEGEIPSEFFVPQPPKLDAKALLDALKGGRIVPGATLTNGGQGLSIRRK